MTKACLDNMVKGLAQELRSDSIRVNGIAPGLIKTKMSAGIWKQKGIEPEKIGKPDQIASVVACICSDKDGGFMNGEIYQVNGGYPKL